MIFEMSGCGGCKTCMIACSFHHERQFKPAASSLIVKQKKEGSGYYIEIVEEEDGEKMACDGCKDLEVPLCIEYCEEREDLENIIKAFLSRTEKKA